MILLAILDPESYASEMQRNARARILQSHDTKELMRVECFFLQRRPSVEKLDSKSARGNLVGFDPLPAP
jgi:hypothetical protein